MSNIVIYINCYNEDERFTTLKKAYEKYFEGYIFCEGHEKERYKNICDNIKNNNYEVIKNEANQIIAVRYYDNTKKQKGVTNMNNNNTQNTTNNNNNRKEVKNMNNTHNTAKKYHENCKRKEVIAKNVKLNVYIKDKVVKYHAPKNANKVVHDDRINYTGFVYEDTHTLEIMQDLAKDLVQYLDNNKVYEVHCDPKKRKLMIRTNGSMIFKIFVQKNCYKIHLKNKSDYEQFKDVNINEVFYQNGFNLPYAYKTNIDTVHNIVKAIA